jgi:hypothetical protein
MNNTDPNYMNRLKEKVTEHGGTFLFDLQFLLGFWYVRIFTIKDTTDSLFQLHGTPRSR